MGQAKTKESTPLLKELAKGDDRVLYKTNSAYLKQFNENLALAVKEQSSYNEVTVVDYRDSFNLEIQMFISKVLNGLVMHTKISDVLEDNKVLEKLMRLMPLKGVAIFEANKEFISKYDLVKEGTPLVNNIKSGYAPSIYYKSNVLCSDKSTPKVMDRDTAIALQVLDVHSDEMFREFGIEVSKMLKPIFAMKDASLISVEYSIGIDTQNNMRLVDVVLEVKKNDKILSNSEIVKLLK